MPNRPRLPALLLAAGLACILTIPVVAESDAERVDKLIEQLGSSSYHEREAASKALEAVGAPALESLRKAADSDDIEVRRRAAELVKRIEKNAETNRVLTGKRVHLVYKETPLAQAVADFAKKTGYELELHDAEHKLADRKITLDTGDVPFWQAFDQFCEQAKVNPLSPQEIMRQMMQRQMQDQMEMMKKMAPAGAVPKGAPPGIPAPPAAALVTRAASSTAPGFDPRRLMLTEGQPPRRPTDYHGAVRFRALPLEAQPGGQDSPPEISLEITLEPKLQFVSVLATQVSKALDDRGRPVGITASAIQGEEPPNFAGVGPGGRRFAMRRRPTVMPAIGPQQVTLQLKKGERSPRMLRELSGTVSMQVLDEPQAMITVEHPDKAAGKTAEGKTGGRIRVLEVPKPEDDQLRLRVEHELPNDVVAFMDTINPRPLPSKKTNGTPDEKGSAPKKEQKEAKIQPGPAAPAAGFTPVRGAPFAGYNFRGLTLRDEKDRSYPLAEISVTGRAVMAGAILWTYDLTFHVPREELQSARLVFSGRRTVSVEAPFLLKDVPLK